MTAELGEMRGVGFIVLNRNSEIALGKRTTATGLFEFAVPGGSVELDELVEEGGIRETREESGLRKLTILGCASEVYNQETGWTNFGIVAVSDDEALMPVQPDEMVEWRWYDSHEVERLWREGKIFRPSARSLEDYFKNKEYWENLVK